MFQKTISVGLIGSGARLRVLVTAIQKQAPQSIRFAAVHDPDPISIEETQKVLGGGVRVCGTVEELINFLGVDWIFIGSWNCFHAQQAVAALLAGKHVFCEKPLATTLQDCVAVREALHKTDRTFALGLVLRYSKHYQTIYETLRSGLIGQIVSFEFNETLLFSHGSYIFGNWRRLRTNAGTHLLEKCCHDLDLANWLIDSLPVRGASFGGNRVFTPESAHLAGDIAARSNGHSIPKMFDPHGVDPFKSTHDILDHQVAILEYANGVQATFHTNAHSALPERRMYINGTLGTLRADLIRGQVEICQMGRESEPVAIRTTSGDIHGDADDIMAAGLIRTMLEDEAPLASIEEGIRSAVTAFGLDEAADHGTVTDFRPLWRCAGVFLP